MCEQEEYYIDLINKHGTTEANKIMLKLYNDPLNKHISSKKSNTEIINKENIMFQRIITANCSKAEYGYSSDDN